jgi:acyl carrier protein
MVIFVKSDSRDFRRHQVIEILKKVLIEEDLHDDLSRLNPNWDSLKHLQISLEIEDYFGVELSDEEASQFYDVDSILILLDRITKNGR